MQKIKRHEKRYNIPEMEKVSLEAKLVILGPLCQKWPILGVNFKGPELLQIM